MIIYHGIFPIFLKSQKYIDLALEDCWWAYPKNISELFKNEWMSLEIFKTPLKPSFKLGPSPLPSSKFIQNNHTYGTQMLPGVWMMQLNKAKI